MWAINGWEFLAGLGLFLYGINQVEAALKKLSGRKFKILIRKHTKNKGKSILVGTLSTMILQSSSAITLMLIALVGSGVLAFPNAVGIILGANLGTTFTGWVVSTFGFEVDIQRAILPIIAIGSMLYVFFSSRKTIADWGKLLIGFGLLFFGLAMMKDSVSALKDAFDFEAISSYNIYVFALAGFIFTAIIQSSSATMAITLTTLNANLISLEGAAALVVGADLGTTVTAILGTVGGTPEKKRVAAAHFFFNLSTTVFALTFLHGLLDLVELILGDSTPLYSLVLFQSSFNIIGIILFFPFLGTFSRMLEQRFNETNGNGALLKVDPKHPEAAIEALFESAKRLVNHSKKLNLSVMEGADPKSFAAYIKSMPQNDFMHRYAELKAMEADILNHAVKMAEPALTEEDATAIRYITIGINQLGFSRKALKDIIHNLKEFRNSSNEAIHGITVVLGEDFQDFYKSITTMLSETDSKRLSERLSECTQKNEVAYKGFLYNLDELIKNDKIPTKYIPSLFNVSREIYTSNRSMIFAVDDILIKAT